MAKAAEFERHVATLSKGPLTYYRAGQGTGVGADILYFHAAAGLHIGSLPRRLAENFRVWIPVAPGYEGTPILDGVNSVPAIAELVSEFIAKEIRGPVDPIGTSFGARLAAWLTILHPEQVSHLVLMSPAGFRPPDAPPLSFDPEIMTKQLYAHPENKPAETRSPVMLETNRAAMRHYGIGSSFDEELNNRIGEIDKVTLVLHGTKDVRVLPQSVQMLRYKIKLAQLVYVYDAAHSLDVDQPQRVGDLVEDFLLRGEAFIVHPGTPKPAQERAAP